METFSKPGPAKVGPMNPDQRPPARSGFSVRIRKLATIVGGAKRLSERSGLSRAVIGKYLSGKSDPSRERLVKLADAAGISIRWLATGEGEMSRHDDSFVFMPGSEIGSGQLSVASDQAVDYVAFKTEWVRESLRADPGRLALIEARGDAMAPTIHGGDLLLIEMSAQSFGPEGVYAIIRPDGLAVKRLVRRLDGMIEVRSDNPLHGYEVASPGAFNVMGRVLWFGRRL
jgi:phage repressor protein C with HTH and peptisase S24 domain